jgi:protein-disulfide isomerase
MYQMDRTPMTLRTPLRLALPLALGLALPAAAPLAALDLTAMTEAEKAAFGDAVRAYLMENPTVLIEVINLLEEQEAAAAEQMDQQLAQANMDLLLNDGHSWVGGNPDGDITVVEFLDYRCGYCRRAFEEVNRLIAADGNIRFVVKEYPILGEESLVSAQFAVAVHQLHGDAVYSDVHDALMALNSEVNPATLTRLAEAFALDPAPILARMETPEVMAVLEANQALGQAMQISGTPTFVIGDQMVRGYVPLERMAAIVAQERGD